MPGTAATRLRRALRRRGHHVVHHGSANGSPRSRQLRHPVVSPAVHAAIPTSSSKWAKDDGKTVVYEMDDDYWHVDKTNPAFKIWGQPGHAEPHSRSFVRMADLVTTTTGLTGPLGRPLNRSVHDSPQHAAADHWPEKPVNDRSSHTIPFGSGGPGVATHYVDLKIVQPALEQIIEQRDDRRACSSAGRRRELDRWPRAPPHIGHPADGEARQVPCDAATRVRHRCRAAGRQSLQPAQSDLKFVEYARARRCPTIVSSEEPLREDGSTRRDRLHRSQRQGLAQVSGFGCWTTRTSSRDRGQTPESTRRRDMIDASARALGTRLRRSHLAPSASQATSHLAIG